MSTPPIILVLDVSTLTKTDIRDWLGFSRAGTCFIPQTVFEEMRFLYDRSPDADLERVSREFNRFHPSSGWRIVDASGHHPLLKSSSGRALTRRVRVALAVARCAYGVAQQSSHSLVVLVADDESIAQRIADMRTANLTSISCADLLQWSRSGQRPGEVQSKLQAMRSATMDQSRVTVSVGDARGRENLSRSGGRSARTHSGMRSHERPSPSPQRLSQTSTVGRTDRYRHSAPYRSYSRPVSSSHRYVKRQSSQLLALITALGAVIFAGAIVWALFNTTYFEQFLPTPPASESAN